MPEPDLSPPPWGLGAVAVAFAVGYVVAVLFGSIAVAAGASSTGAITTAASFVGEWVGFFGVPVWLSRHRGCGRMATDFGLRFGGPADLGLGVGGGLVAWGAVWLYTTLLKRFDHVDLNHEAQQLLGHGHGVTAAFALSAVIAGLGAPIAEETFFRGLTQPVLQRRLGGWSGLILTSAFFGLVHLSGNPVEAIPALAFVGFVAGSLAWRTGRLGPGIIAHVVFNGITIGQYAVSR